MIFEFREGGSPAMKRFGYSIFAALALVTVLCTAHVASATPVVNGAVTTLRVFDNCPSATVVATNSYPASISIVTSNNDCFAFAERHAWSFSADGGVTPADFANGDQFSYCATLFEDGDGGGEAGLRLSPWWSLDVDGTFNCRSTDGEIAIFGGRLPFYSFTDPAHGGLHYPKGAPIQLMIDYKPNGLSLASPATITYSLILAGTPYSSGPLAFDQGNPAEDPPHGQWGCLSPARVGGHAQAFCGQGQPVTFAATWQNICYEASPTPAANTSWGKIKANYR
jgi:hypothetical protein